MDELKTCAVKLIDANALKRNIERKYMPSDTISAGMLYDLISTAPEVNLRPAPENKPLTLEQLRQMDGEPVWVVFAGNADWPPKAHWCFVRATKCILQVYPCAVHQAKNWMYTEQDFSCGVANAYTRKPESK